jgi:hypothetical protein
METVAIAFDHSHANSTPPFRPLMQEAEVRLPAVEQFIGKGVGTKITYDPNYVERGFDGVVGGVFAKIVGDGIKLGLPAERAGGLATPTQTLKAISSELGGVPELRRVGPADFAPADMSFLKDSKLLGAIDLADALAPISKSADMPKLTVEPGADGLRIRFAWIPPLRDELPEPLVRIDSVKPTLDLKGSVFRPTGQTIRAQPEPLSDIKGTLTDFGLVFAGVAQVHFKSLTFHMVTGQKPEFSADIKNVKFLGQLEFVNKLSECLTKQGVGSASGPTLTISPEGVTAGIGLAIPNISLGALGLQNIVLSSRLSLFFAKAAELRFALSSREHPFLISYSLLGGGGFFALTVTSERDTVAVEASLEFGAVAAIDIFIAKGEVQAMVGVYFSIKGDKALLEGFIRLFGCVEVLQVITVSVEFYLRLSYDGRNATGTASLTVMVRVLMFSKSVTLTVTRSFSTADAVPLLAGGTTPVVAFRSFADSVSLPQWTEYCKAFAPHAHG